MAKSRRRALHFTHVHLENWCNFRDVDVDLSPRVFLVGPNASGKSNFQDLFRFLRDVASVGGGLQAAVQRRGGVSSLRCLAARRYPDISIGVKIGADDETSMWEYLLSFNQDKQRRLLIKQERVVREGRELLNRPSQEDRADPDRLSQTYLEQVLANKEFRDLVEFFQSVRYLHIVPQLIREPDRSVGRSDDPFGGDFLEQVAKTTTKTRDARLRKILKALQVAVPQIEDLDLKRDNQGRPHLLGKYSHWRPQGAWQGEEQLSDGTLRLLGLMWVVLDGGGPLLLEEPELSLHPEVVRRIPSMLARVQRGTPRQIVISTHSTDLLEDPGIGLDELLLLKPEREGTSVSQASKIEALRGLVKGGDMPLGEAVMPATSPENVEQLVFWPE